MNARVSLAPNVDVLSLLPNSVENRLKSYGFTQGRIIDAVKEYLKSHSEIDASGFVSFAVNQFSSSSVVPHLWFPLGPTSNYLRRKGVSDEIIERCLSNFRGKKLSFKPESLDSCFVQYCLRALDNEKQSTIHRNRIAIPDHWYPSLETNVYLTSILNGWPDREWDIGEYRLYWIEAGGKKDNWDQHFISYMKKKYHLT